MRARRARLETATPGTGAPVVPPAGVAAVRAAAPAQAAATAQVPTAGAAPSAPSPSTPLAAAPGPATAVSGDGLTLQVGVFSVRDNAERALAALHGAGIPAARMQDVVRAGQTLWRVRVGPVAGASIADLASRVTGLGL